MLKRLDRSELEAQRIEGGQAAVAWCAAGGSGTSVGGNPDPGDALAAGAC
jgi:hypothetical protein